MTISAIQRFTSTALRRAAVGLLGAGSLILPAAAVAQDADPDRQWGQWRGPAATGASDTATPPLRWGESENVRWKIEIPGRGIGSPVIWGDRLFLTTAIPVGVEAEAAHQPRGGQTPFGPHRFVVMAIARSNGSVLWKRTVREEIPHEPTHGENGSWASNSVATDGDRVFAYFESRGLFAFDLDGNALWEKDFGDKSMRNQFGEGSTPVLYDDRLVLVWDHIGGQSFVAALDTATGAELWRVNRDEIDTWATPLVVAAPDGAQVVVPGMERLRSYALSDGSVVWESDGLTMNPIPSPVSADGLVIAMSGYRGNDLKAIRVAGAMGDITHTDSIVWELDRDTPYVPSPLLYDGILYFLKTNSGILSAFEAETGAPLFERQRLQTVRNVFASPVAANGRVYVVGRDGTTVVIRHGSTFEILGSNSLDDHFDASPALVDNELYLRGHRYLYSLGVK